MTIEYIAIALAALAAIISVIALVATLRNRRSQLTSTILQNQKDIVEGQEPRQKLDDVSATIRAATDILFLRNVQRTSLGILVGMIIWILLLVSQPLHGIDVSQIGWFAPVILGLFAVYLPRIVSYFLGISPSHQKQLAESLKYIELAQRGANLSEAQVRLMYIALYRKILENISETNDLKLDMDATALEGNDKNNP